MRKANASGGNDAVSVMAKLLNNPTTAPPMAAMRKRAELAADTAYVDSVLEGSAIKARALARTVLARARLACGLD